VLLIFWWATAWSQMSSQRLLTNANHALNHGWLFGLVVLSWVSNVASGVGASMRAFAMPRSPFFLLVLPTLECAMLMLLIAKMQGEEILLPLKNAATRHHIFCLTALALSNGLCFGISDAWVSGVAAQILINATIPAVGFSSIYILGERFTKRELIGTVVVLCGIFVGMLPQMHKSDDQLESNPCWAVLLYACSVSVLGVQMTIQDRACRAGIPPATLIFWYSLLAVPVYLVLTPCETVAYINGSTTGEPLANLGWNQLRSLRCMAGIPLPGDVPEFCSQDAWLWLQVWTVGYCMLFFLNAVQMCYFNAFWVAIVNTAGAPLSAVVFTMSSIVGEANVQEVAWPCTTASFTLILLGIVVKGVPDKSGEQHWALEQELSG